MRQRANTAALHGKLLLVHAVWRTQPTIQQLLAAGDFPGALELITSSQQLLDTGAPLSRCPLPPRIEPPRPAARAPPAAAIERALASPTPQSCVA